MKLDIFTVLIWKPNVDHQMRKNKPEIVTVYIVNMKIVNRIQRTWIVIYRFFGFQSICVGVLACAGGLGLAGYLDMTTASYPSWFRGLRFVLTSVAVFSFLLSLICKLVLDEERRETRKEEETTESPRKEQRVEN